MCNDFARVSDEKLCEPAGETCTLGASVSQVKLKSIPLSPAVLPERRRAITALHIAWGLVRPHGDESCRWQAADGRWVAVTVGSDDELGKAIVTDSGGRRELATSFEDALALARSWRT